MGIYNCAPYLQQALDSLYAQTYRDFDIILCDDGSTDDTYAIARRNADMHPEITLLRNDTNQGLNITLNHCLAAATGEYIARMDGDDISYPDRFERQVAFLDSHPEYAIVSCPMHYFDETGIVGRGLTREGCPPVSSFRYSAPFCHAPSMVRRSAYEAVGGYTVGERFLRVEDYNLWMKMYAIGYRGYNLGEILYAMRDNHDAYQRRSFQNRMNDIYVHHIAYRVLHLPLIHVLQYDIRTFLVAILPNWLYKPLHQWRYNRNQKLINII